MGFWDRVLGSADASRQTPPAGPTTPRSDDEIAIERYRYLLRTAPPETIEQVHAEAFARLTEDQRRQVLADLSAGLEAAEQPRSTDPQSMARAATRAEYRSPGFMERTLGGGDGDRGGRGPGFGAMVGSTILGTVAGYVIGSALVSAFTPPVVSEDAGAVGDGSGYDAADVGDFGGGDFGGF